jgi:cell division protein FtsB
LEAEKTRLETDFEYIEQLAREKYRMAKPGEKVFKVLPKNADE